MADLFLYNGNIITLDGETPVARAMAPENGGTINLQGRTVVPGFNDNHAHTLSMAENLTTPNLAGRSSEEIVNALKYYYRNIRPGELVTGSAWDYTSCPEPHLSVLDKTLCMFREAGITTVQDNSFSPPLVWNLREFRRDGHLTCRFSCWSYGARRNKGRRMGLVRYDPPWIRRGPWKYFIDGAFSTRNAWLTEPFLGDEGNCGRSW